MAINNSMSIKKILILNIKQNQDVWNIIKCVFMNVKTNAWNFVKQTTKLTDIFYSMS